MTDVSALVEQLANRLRERGASLVTAESCTGGMVAAACTAIAGSSDWFDRGFVTYSNDAKVETLGVAASLIEAHGAVSAEVALAMAEGALARSGAGLAVAITGIAGPGGGTAAKPVGTVWLAVAGLGSAARPTLLQAAGDRSAVRAASVKKALQLLIEWCETAVVD